MLDALDLTPRQANRLLEQAVRAAARLEIEPRSFPDGRSVRAVLKGREGSTLLAEVSSVPPDMPAISLMGAFCEVRSALSGQIFIFTSCVLDVIDAIGPVRLSLAVPEIIQVTNRRRFERTNATVASEVYLLIDDETCGGPGGLANISPDGLGCTFPAEGLDERVLVGEPLRVRFEIAGFDEEFELPALVCNKTLSRDQKQITIGLEFDLARTGKQDARMLERVRGMLNQLMNSDTPRSGGA